MATIEHEQARAFPVALPRTERAVFVTESSHRARTLRYGAAVVVLLACLWLAGLGIGMLGLGRLPGLSLAVPDRADDGARSEQATKVVRPPSQPSRARPAAARVTPSAQRRAAQTRSQLSTRSQTRAGRRTPVAKVPAPPRATPPPPAPAQNVQPPQAPATPQPVPRGLERRGLTAPPGQTQKATEPPAPPGQTRRQEGSTTTTPEPAPAPAPPGQQQKLDEPKG
jgi:hypothetical protein